MENDKFKTGSDRQIPITIWTIFLQIPLNFPAAQQKIVEKEEKLCNAM